MTNDFRAQAAHELWRGETVDDGAAFHEEAEKSRTEHRKTQDAFNANRERLQAEHAERLASEAASLLHKAPRFWGFFSGVRPLVSKDWRDDQKKGVYLWWPTTEDKSAIT